MTNVNLLIEVSEWLYEFLWLGKGKESFTHSKKFFGFETKGKKSDAHDCNALCVWVIWVIEITFDKRGISEQNICSVRSERDNINTLRKYWAMESIGALLFF